MKNKTIKVKAIGLGVVILQGRKKGYAFQFLDEDNNPIEGSEIFFSSKMSHGAGNIYELEMSENKETVYGKPRWIDRHPDEKLRTLTSLKSKANETELTAYAQQKKAEKSNEDILSCLLPLRRMYWSTNAAGRLALQVRILNFLQNKDKL